MALYQTFQDKGHHEIHEGNSFVACGVDTLGVAGTKILLITTANNNKYAHLLIKLRAQGETTLQLYENPTVSNVGTAVNNYNRNRNKTNTSGASVTHSPTKSADGTLLCTESLGSGQNTSGEIRGDSEFVLKQNEQYLIVITSASADNAVNWMLDWYEERV